MYRQLLSIKTILNSMVSTLLLLLLVMGFIVVEKNTRKIGFADNNPWFICKDSRDEGHYIKIRFMNGFYMLDFSSVYDVTDLIAKNVILGMNSVKNLAENISK